MLFLSPEDTILSKENTYRSCFHGVRALWGIFSRSTCLIVGEQPRNITLNIKRLNAYQYPESILRTAHLSPAKVPITFVGCYLCKFITQTQSWLPSSIKIWHQQLVLFHHLHFWARYVGDTDCPFQPFPGLYRFVSNSHPSPFSFKAAPSHNFFLSHLPFSLFMFVFSAKLYWSPDWCTSQNAHMDSCLRQI